MFHLLILLQTRPISLVKTSNNVCCVHELLRIYKACKHKKSHIKNKPREDHA